MFFKKIIVLTIKYKKVKYNFFLNLDISLIFRIYIKKQCIFQGKIIILKKYYKFWFFFIFLKQKNVFQIVHFFFLVSTSVLIIGNVCLVLSLLVAID